VRHGRGDTTQFSAHHVMFGHTVDLCDSYRSFREVWVDPVLLPAAMPGYRHLRPNTPDVILALHEPFPSCQHRAPARAHGRRLRSMPILHVGEPPLVHPQPTPDRVRPAGLLVAAYNKLDMQS
jgi:hypothetical protein